VNRPKPGGRRRWGATLAALALFAALLPANTLAARSWQPPIAPPAGYEFDGLASTVQLDAQGDLAATVKSPGGAYRYAVRPHAGSLLGDLQPFPGTLGEPALHVRETVQNASGDLLMWNGSGNLVGYRPAPIFSVAFGPSSFTNVQSLPAAAGTIEYVAMTAAGETFAQTLKGDPNEATPTSETQVLFRPSGPLATFGVEPWERIPLPPAAGDTGTEPLGIVADPDGRVTAVYRSLPSLRAIQADAPPGGGSFEDFEEIVLTADPAKWQATAVPKIATSYDGHAVLVWGTDRTSGGAAYKSEIWASRRAPGGSFGPREPVVDLDPGHAETDAGGDYGPTGVFGSADDPELFPVALDSGAALVAFNQITEADYCGTPETSDDTEYGAYIAASGAGAWTTTALGSNGNVDFSWVEAIASAGDSVALASSELVHSCKHPPLTSASYARVWQGTTPGPATALDNYGPNGTGIAVNSAGDAAVALGAPPRLHVYEDPGGGSGEPGEPSNPGGGSGGDSGSGGSGGSGPGTPPIGKGRATPPQPRAPGSLRLGKPLVAKQSGRRQWLDLQLHCEADARAACTASVTPLGEAPPVKPASGTVAPGRTKALKTYLTAAGTALLKQKGSFKVRLKIVVRAGADTAAAIKTITVKKG
jgi:hypothetical protein